MIAVIDYGLGNLASAVKAVRAAGAEATVTDDPKLLKRADKIILPGQGAFADGIKNLRRRGLVPALNQQVLDKHKPFLGICLGLQLLGETSFENGRHQGLGWIKGDVIKLKVGKKQKLPHIGWDNVYANRNSPLFSQIPAGSDFYFVHSYYLKPENKNIVAAICDYGQNFPVGLVQNNIWAVLFHPEKSQQAGLQLLKNFVNNE
jgi:glutamine amidotransferase